MVYNTIFVCIEACNGALKLEEGNIKALYRRATAQVVLCNYEDARADLQQLLQLDAKNADALRELARIHRLEEQARAKQRKAFGSLFKSQPSAAPGTSTPIDAFLLLNWALKVLKTEISRVNLHGKSTTPLTHENFLEPMALRKQGRRTLQAEVEVEEVWTPSSVSCRPARRSCTLQTTKQGQQGLMMKANHALRSFFSFLFIINLGC